MKAKKEIKNIFGKYQDDGKVTGDPSVIKKQKEKQKKESELIKLEKSTSGKRFENMSNEEKAFTLERRQSDLVKNYMFGSRPSKRDIEDKKKMDKLGEVRYKLADMYRKEAESKKVKSGKVSK